MPDVANFQEYSELKGLLDSSPDADPAKVSVARDALKRYESQYLGGDNIAHDQSLLAPDTGPRGIDPIPQTRYSRDELAGARALGGGSLGGEGDLSQVIDARSAPKATAAAKAPSQMVQRPGASNLQATAQDMPTHVGGGTIQVVDPPVVRFVRDVAPGLQKTMDPLDFAAMMEDPGQSQQYQEWSDQEWNRQSGEANARGLSAKRLKSSILDTYDPNQPLGDAIGEKANQAFDMLSGGAAAGGRALTLGGTTKLAQVVGGNEAAKALKDSEERHPIVGTAATVVAGANPLNPGNLAARGIGSGLTAIGARVAPKLTGIAPFIGRAAAAGVAGGLSSAGEGAVTDLVENSATGDQSGTSWDAAKKRLALGSALGGGLHIAGEGLGAMSAATDKTYDAELRDAGRIGAEPGFGGVKLAPGSPAQELEGARVKGELKSGATVAAGRVAPKISDQGAAIKKEVFGRAEKETAQAYDRLARGGSGRAAPTEPEIADVPTVMPRPTRDETARHTQLLQHDHAYVTPEQADAVRAHAFGSDDVFKRLQRGEDADAIAADIQATTGRATAGEHVAAAQAHLPHLEEFMASAPPTPGTVYRGIVVSDEQAQKLLGMGEIGMDGAITGSSRDPMVARSFIGRGQTGEPGATHGVTFKLKHTTGRGIEDMVEQGSGYGKTGVEKEVLLPGTARFKVTNRYVDPTKPNNYIIEAEEIGGRNTMPPGAGDAEADAFGRIAQEQGENRASLLGVQQAAQRGAHVTPSPVRVSTAPVVKRLLGILDKHNPAGGETPFIPTDDPLRKQIPNLMRVRVVSPDAAKNALSRSGVGSTRNAEQAMSEGLLNPDEAAKMAPGQVVLIEPRDLDAPTFDDMVKALDDRAKFNKDLADGDARYRSLAEAAREARSGFPGLNELKQRQSEEFHQTDELLKHAGVEVGQGGDVKGWREGSVNQQKSVENAVKQFKQRDNRLTDDALRTVAKLGKFEAELNQVPGQGAVEKLDETMRLGGQVPGTQTGAIRRGYQLSQLHLYPHIKALGGTPAPEKELQAIIAGAAKLSPQLKAALRAMRLDPTAERPVVRDIAGLTSRIGLKGGVAGQRAAAAAEESGLTEEDAKNLLRMKKAAGAN